MNPRRRRLVAGSLAALPVALPATVTAAPSAAVDPGFVQASDESIWPPVVPGEPLRFPRDHGAHAPYRTEWWYLTGWLTEPGGSPLGMQITFFRSRTRHGAANPSRFAPTQLLFAHAALAAPDAGRLAHAERSARAGFGLASFSELDLDVSIGNWHLQREPNDRIVARIDDEVLSMALEFTPPGPPVLQGEGGFSRKGPDRRQASWYYSRPQLAVAGRIRGPGRSPARQVRGHAWLDHEWSSEILHPDAAGWDWLGLNLDDGSALMAFQIRRRDGSVLWADANWISRTRLLGNIAVPARSRPRFTPVRHWRSPRSGASWPVAMALEIDGRSLQLEPLFDDQEIDASASTGTVYWEGAITAREAGLKIGAGYLELTGYAGELSL